MVQWLPSVWTALVSSALLFCAVLLLSGHAESGARVESLSVSFPAAPIATLDPMAAPLDPVEEDRLKVMVRALKSRLSKLNTMMGDWQGKVENFEKDQHSMLRDLSEKRKKVKRDKLDEENFLATPGPAGKRGPDGWAGRPGRDGAMGPMGPAGLIGYEGQQGPVGPQGQQGPGGMTGQFGVQGAQGTPGQFGAQGASGLAGQRGGVGRRGRQGVHGETGAEGPAGWDKVGLPGPAGPRGDMGWMGQSGVPGRAGVPGQPGHMGLPGPMGHGGPAGFTGVPGVPGRQGAVGREGVRGVDGLIGGVGPTGGSGVSGPSGVQGNVGLTGQVGNEGTAGASGWVGTPGQAGVAGPFGVDGEGGSSGAPGGAGGVGTTGTDGPNGAQGAHGTNERNLWSKWLASLYVGGGVLAGGAKSGKPQLLVEHGGLVGKAARTPHTTHTWWGTTPNDGYEQFIAARAGKWHAEQAYRDSQAARKFAQENPTSLPKDELHTPAIGISHASKRPSSLKRVRGGRSRSGGRGGAAAHTHSSLEEEEKAAAAAGDAAAADADARIMKRYGADAAASVASPAGMRASSGGDRSIANPDVESTDDEAVNEMQARAADDEAVNEMQTIKTLEAHLKKQVLQPGGPPAAAAASSSATQARDAGAAADATAAHAAGADEKNEKAGLPGCSSDGASAAAVPSPAAHTRRKQKRVTSLGMWGPVNPFFVKMDETTATADGRGEYGDGSVTALEKQNVDCGANPLVGFHLMSHSPMQYEYTCEGDEVSPDNVRLHYWKLQGDPSSPNELPKKAVTPDIAMNGGAPGGAFGLDGIKVDCGPKGAISGFKFKKQGALNTYQYQCVNPVVGKGPNYAGANFGMMPFKEFKVVDCRDDETAPVDEGIPRNLASAFSQEQAKNLALFLNPEMVPFNEWKKGKTKVEVLEGLHPKCSTDEVMQEFKIERVAMSAGLGMSGGMLKYKFKCCKLEKVAAPGPFTPITEKVAPISPMAKPGPFVPPVPPHGWAHPC